MTAAPGTKVPGLDVANVTAWLEANVAGGRGPFEFRLIAGGHSNLTFAVTGSDGSTYVLRRPPLGHVLASAHDMAREHKIIAALRTTPVPVPPALGFCDDLAVNGAPFYVMGYVAGHVIRDRITAEALLTPAARGRAGFSLAETLAAIHAVDVDAVGLGDLGRKEGYLARQLKRWYGQWNAQKTRELPAVDHVHDILLARIPEQSGVSVVHGDYRLDNCMVDDGGNVIAVLDWEICTLGDPLADVGLLLVYHTGPDDEPTAWTSPATTASGFPNRAELVEHYSAVSGRDVSTIDVYVAFAFWKLACILEGVYARYLGGALGQRDPAELEPFKFQVDQAAAQALAYVERLG